jgi:hypothetical protein
MKFAQDNRRGAAVVLALVALVLAQSLFQAGSAGASTGVGADVNLSSEGRIIDNYVDNLVQYDKKVSEAAKKASLTRAEFDALQLLADDLKRRLSTVQGALRGAVSKLQLAGELANLDQTILRKIVSPRFQALVRNEGFKRTLEEAASGLANDAAEISQPLDALRSKLRAQAPERGLNPQVLRLVRVAYTTAPVVFGKSLRCRLAYVQGGLSGAYYGRPSDKSINRVSCYCDADGASCADLFR